MFFNKSLQQENQRLKQELQILQQIQTSLDEEMIRLTLDSKGIITSANTKLQQELFLNDDEILTKSITELVPS
ncbi:chemotaxis protein, partial [Vibrio parahaemolyticus]|nr:chemotaxis protein [Vibrio parahaemolyticus]